MNTRGLMKRSPGMVVLGVCAPLVSSLTRAASQISRSLTRSQGGGRSDLPSKASRRAAVNAPWPSSGYSIENCLPVEELNTTTPPSALARSAATMSMSGGAICFAPAKTLPEEQGFSPLCEVYESVTQVYITKGAAAEGDIVLNVHLIRQKVELSACIIRPMAGEKHRRHVTGAHISLQPFQTLQNCLYRRLLVHQGLS